MSSTRLFFILNLIGPLLQTASSILKSLDQDDKGLDDETAEAIHVAADLVQAFLTRKDSGQ